MNNDNIFMEINRQIDSAVEGSIVIESTILDEYRAPPSVRVVRHSSGQRFGNTPASTGFHINQTIDSNGRYIVAIPQLVADDFIEMERPRSCCDLRKMQRKPVNVRPKRKPMSKGDDESITDSKEVERPAEKNIGNKCKKLESSCYIDKTLYPDAVSAKNLRLNLNCIGSQLELIEDSLAVPGTGILLKSTSESVSTKLTTAHPKPKSMFTSAAELNYHMKPYNPNDYLDTSNVNDLEGGDCGCTNFGSLDETIFVSDFGKSVAKLCNKSTDDPIFMMSDRVLCDYAEKQKLKNIRHELKKWKREYFLKTGRHFVEQSETICGKPCVSSRVLNG